MVPGRTTTKWFYFRGAGRMTAEVNQHHPTPPPAPTSCRNPNKKTSQRFSSRQLLHFKKALGYHLYLSENIKPSTFSSQVFSSAAAGRRAQGSPGAGCGWRGAEAAPGVPGAPGSVPDQTPPCVLPPRCFSGGESRDGGAGSAGARGAGWGREAVGGQEAERGRWKPSRRASAARKGPALPRKAEAWSTYGGTKAMGPKGADFVLLYFSGKLLSWLRRGGQAGREPA